MAFSVGRKLTLRPLALHASVTLAMWVLQACKIIKTLLIKILDCNFKKYINKLLKGLGKRFVV